MLYHRTPTIFKNYSMERDIAMRIKFETLDKADIDVGR